MAILKAVSMPIVMTKKKMDKDQYIKQQFQQQFNDFESPVPLRGWEALEDALDNAKVVKIDTRRRWYAGAVAAVLMLLVGSTFYFRNANHPTLPIETEIANVPIPASSVEQPIETEIEIPSSKTTQPLTQTETLVAQRQPIVASQPSSQPSEATPTPTPTPTQSSSTILAEWFERIKEQVVAATSNLSTNTQVDESAERRRNENEFQLSDEVILLADNNQEGIHDAPQKRRGENLSVAFGSRSGVAPFHATVNTPMTLRSALPSGSGLFYSDQNPIENVSELEHDQPISFGLTVSKTITNNISIETGLVYTYLSSRVRNTSLNRSEQETQRLHYIGIPLNLNYTVLNIRDFNLFASVGGMIEKDVYGEYRRLRLSETSQTFDGQSTEREIATIRQRNPQLSVNAGVGVSYPIIERLRLYGKVGGSYYFDAKNEHKTIYSDGRIVMNLNIGLRYKF